MAISDQSSDYMGRERPTELVAIDAPVGPISYHQLAELFPLELGTRLLELAADIKLHGMRDPVVFYEGKILDGRHRYSVAMDLRIDYPAAQYVGEDPLAFVISRNLVRRHLSQSGRTMAASRIVNLEQGRPRKGNRANSPVSAISHLVSLSSAAGLFNISETSIKLGRRILLRGVPELVALTDQAIVSVSAAAAVASLSTETQRRIVGRGADAVIDAARFIRNEDAPTEHLLPIRKSPPQSDKIQSTATLGEKLIINCLSISVLLKQHDAVRICEDLSNDKSREQNIDIIQKALTNLVRFLEEVK